MLSLNVEYVLLTFKREKGSLFLSARLNLKQKMSKLKVRDMQTTFSILIVFLNGGSRRSIAPCVDIILLKLLNNTYRKVSVQIKHVKTQPTHLLLVKIDKILQQLKFLQTCNPQEKVRQTIHNQGFQIKMTYLRIKLGRVISILIMIFKNELLLSHIIFLIQLIFFYFE